MTKIQEIKNYTELQWLEVADKYSSASQVLREEFNMSENGRYIKLINSILKNLDIKFTKPKFKGQEKRICPVCNVEFITYISENKITCSYSCSNTYFRSGKNNGRYKAGHGTNYRNIAFNNYPNKCANCGEKDKEVLVVHHKDHNRKNNIKENLQILCANCHIKLHKSECRP